MDHSREFCFEAPGARVLLVDDNEMNITVERLHIEPLHMTVDTALNGAEAIDLMEENHYDLVFMDQMMPVMDGCEATSIFRETEDAYHENLPIICITANVMPESKCKCRVAGFNDFLGKPVKAEGILSMVRKWLPKEKIIETDEPVIDYTPIQEETLPEIVGIHVEEGVACAGSVDHWKGLLRDYYRIIDLKTQVIEDALSAENLKRYTTEVHGLKSTSRMIGATELGEEFFVLEKLGQEDNIYAIREKTPIVLKHFGLYKERLRSFAEADDEKKEVSMDEIIETLQSIHDAMDGFDLEGADAQMQKLRGYDLPESFQPRVDRLGALVSDVEMETVMEETENMSKNVKEELG